METSSQRVAAAFHGCRERAGRDRAPADARDSSLARGWNVAAKATAIVAKIGVRALIATESVSRLRSFSHLPQGRELARRAQTVAENDHIGSAGKACSRVVGTGTVA
jgi:hypothetical protein